MYNNRRDLKLLEDRLYNEIEETLIEEGFFGGLSSLGGYVGNGIRNAGNNVRNRMQAAGNSIRTGMQNMANNGKEIYGRARDAYQRGSAEQDKRKALNKCVKYYQNNSRLFAQANYAKQTIKQMARQYGFSLDDVRNAARMQ